MLPGSASRTTLAVIGPWADRESSGANPRRFGLVSTVRSLIGSGGRTSSKTQAAAEALLLFALIPLNQSVGFGGYGWGSFRLSEAIQARGVVSIACFGARRSIHPPDTRSKLQRLLCSLPQKPTHHCAAITNLDESLAFAEFVPLPGPCDRACTGCFSERFMEPATPWVQPLRSPWPADVAASALLISHDVAQRSDRQRSSPAQNPSLPLSP